MDNEIKSNHWEVMKKRNEYITKIIDEYEPSLKKFIKSVVYKQWQFQNDPNIVEEIINETFMQLIINYDAGKINFDIPIRPYLYAIAMNVTRNIMRKSKKNQRELFDSYGDVNDWIDKYLFIEDKYSTHENEIFNEFLSLLNQKDKDSYMDYIENRLSHEQVVSKRGISLGSSKMRKKRFKSRCVKLWNKIINKF